MINIIKFFINKRYYSQKIIIDDCNNENYYFVCRRNEKITGLASDIIYFLGQLKYKEKHFPNAITYIDLEHCEQGITEKKGNAWDYFFEQPGGNIKKKNYNRILASCNGDIKYDVPWFFDYETLKKMGYQKLFDENIIIRDDLLKEFNYRISSLNLSNQKVLGVKARGTDYSSMKPVGHAVQPTFEELKTKIDEVLCSEKFDVIFLATEDETIQKKFKELYSDKVILNSKSNLFECKSNSFLLERIDKSISRHNISKEYLFEMYALSKCAGLISGKNSGIIPILLWNGGKYDYTYIFDLGQY